MFLKQFKIAFLFKAKSKINQIEDYLVFSIKKSWNYSKNFDKKNENKISLNSA